MPSLSTAFTFNIQRSKILIDILFFIYGGAILCVIATPFKLITKILLLIFCVSAFLYQYWQKILFGGKETIVALAYNGNDRKYKWSLYDKQRRIIKAQLQKSSVVLPYFTVLHFKIDNTPYSYCHRFVWQFLPPHFLSLLIFCDAMPKEDFRKLRVYAVIN